MMPSFSPLAGRFQQPPVEKSKNLGGTANHAIEKDVEFHLGALRVLRGGSLPISAAAKPVGRGT